MKGLNINVHLSIIIGLHCIICISMLKHIIGDAFISFYICICDTVIKISLRATEYHPITISICTKLHISELFSSIFSLYQIIRAINAWCIKYYKTHMHTLKKQMSKSLILSVFFLKSVKYAYGFYWSFQTFINDLFDLYIWTASMRTLARSTWPCFIASVANSTKSWRWWWRFITLV